MKELIKKLKSSINLFYMKLAGICDVVKASCKEYTDFKIESISVKTLRLHYPDIVIPKNRLVIIDTDNDKIWYPKRAETKRADRALLGHRHKNTIRIAEVLTSPFGHMPPMYDGHETLITHEHIITLTQDLDKI